MIDIIYAIGLFAFLGIWIFLCIYLLRGFFKDTPYYPSRIGQLDELWSYLDIDSKDKKFIDIGSGDGRTVFWASRKGMIAHGIDINPYLTLLSRFRNLFSKNKKHVSFTNGDFFKADYSDYNIIYLYIFKEAMEGIKDNLFTKTKPGTLIISNVFSFKDIEPTDKFKRFKIYKVK